MKINKIADEKLAPNWAFDEIKSASVNDWVFHGFSEEEIERIKGLATEILSEDQIVDERDCIEQCASSSSKYHYSSKWNDETKKSLREYAIVCGMKMDNFVEVDVDQIVVDRNIIASDVRDARMVKEAETEIDLLQKLKSNDPFKIDELGDMSHLEETNWQDVKKQENLTDKPSMMSGAVKGLRGGEDYFENSYTQTAKGQNSITNPNAIKDFVESEVEDNGARLKRENEAKVEAKKAEHAEWEQGKIDEMEHKDIIPKGKVFNTTEGMNAQSGLNTPSSQMGVYADFDPNDIPEKTVGETLAKRNEDRRQEIQGKDKEKHEFSMKSASVRSISDTFAEELKKHI